ncbi:MAG: adenylosuccinate lyase [Acetobacteraceae bacterium]|nr:adenylosuccinate lyase [Acetobacteraceae bacterium]
MLERYALPEMAAVWSERHRLELWRRVEVLAVEGWALVGAVPSDAASRLARAADFPLDDGFIRRVRELEAEVRHDVIAFVTALGERLGEDARYLHLGLTSYDVVDTALSAALVESADLLMSRVRALSVVLADLARRHRGTVMAGRTHGVLAQPITFGWKMCVWWAQLQRDLGRLEAAREAVGVGKVSGAVGTYARLDPRVEEHVCRCLGLTPDPASTQVLGRDRHAQFLSTLALCAGTLERFAAELRLLSRTEVREVEEPFYPGQKGSSAMPHKRNPVQCERIAGLARVIRGHAHAALENVALWHERDLSNSAPERIILPQSCLLLDFMLDSFRRVVEGLRVFPDRMLRNLDAGGGLAFSEAVMLALVERGMDRDEAYRLVQSLATQAWEGQGGFRQLVEDDPRIAGVLSSDELQQCFDLKRHLRHLDAVYRRLGLDGG